MEITAANLGSSPLATESLDNQAFGLKKDRLYLLDLSQLDGYDSSIKAFETFMILLSQSKFSPRNKELFEKNVASLEKRASLHILSLPTELIYLIFEELATMQIDPIFRVCKKFREDIQNVVCKIRIQNLQIGLGKERFNELKYLSGVKEGASDKEIVKAVFAQLRKEARSINEGRLPRSKYEPFSIAGIRVLNQFIEDQNFLIFVSRLPGGEAYLFTISKKELHEKAQLSRERFHAVSESFYHEQKLSFFKKKIVVLPSEIGVFRGLEYLDLYNNKITFIPAAIGNLVSLQILSLSYNRIREIPREIGALTLLKKLDVVANKLEDLPSAIGNLVNLEKLNLGENKLTCLPAEIEGLTSLQSLGLMHNRITAIPAGIGRITSLKMLNLFDNELTTLPSTIGNLVSLHHLSLAWNNFTILPEELMRLAGLTLLDVSENRLKSLPDGMWELSSLKALYAFNNRLTTLPDVTSAEPAVSLERLYLSNNNITSCSLEILQFPSLQIVDL